MSAPNLSVLVEDYLTVRRDLGYQLQGVRLFSRDVMLAPG